MERLSDWRAAAWLAFCLAAIAVGAALLVPAANRHGPRPPAQTMRATIVPRTHLFGQRVTATLDVPASFSVHTSFSPYQVVSREIRKDGGNARYRFVLDCLRSTCLGPAGEERQVQLPPVKLGSPDGKTYLGLWPLVRQASRLAPTDLASPEFRGDLAPPDRSSARGHRLLFGILLALAGTLAVTGAAIVGIRRLGWQPETGTGGNGRRDPSDLDYALLAAGLAAGGDQADRRTVLESLAVALDRRGLGELARQARSLAWSPRPPANETVRRIAERAQRVARKERV
jgi:hypothetical protein